MKPATHAPVAHIVRANAASHWLQGVAACLVGFVCYSRIIDVQPELPTADAIRYINSALNILEHQVFSMGSYQPNVAPQPGLLMGGPLTAVELALAAMLDPQTRETFECVIAQPSGCAVQLSGLKWLRLAELGGAMGLLWLLARRVLGAPGPAWLLCLIVLGCNDYFYYAGLALAEPSYILFSVATLYLLIRTGDPDGNVVHAALLGVCLGSVCLIKPSATLWVPLIIVLLPARALLASPRRIDRALLAAVILVGGLSTLLVGGWMARNWWVSGALAVADPHYLTLALAHRAGYNAMTSQEWLIGWIYYLPDFGDALAEDLFTRADYVRLGWGTEGLYVYGRDELAESVMHPPDGSNPRAYLLEKHVFNEPVKHGLVSALLAFRGAFVSKYWGLLAWLLVPLAWRLLPREARTPLALTLLPPVVLLIAHSLISVSISRYNIALIPALALSLTTVAWIVPQRFFQSTRWKARNRANR